MAKINRSIRPNQKAVANTSWTFFTNHTHVLVFLSLHGDAPLKEVAAGIGITERAVQKIVHQLEVDGIVIKKKLGRRNTYKLNSEVHLRHPLEKHCTIGEILAVVLGSFPRKGVRDQSRD